MGSFFGVYFVLVAASSSLISISLTFLARFTYGLSALLSFVSRTNAFNVCLSRFGLKFGTNCEVLTFICIPSVCDPPDLGKHSTYCCSYLYSDLSSSFPCSFF